MLPTLEQKISTKIQALLKTIHQMHPLSISNHANFKKTCQLKDHFEEVNKNQTMQLRCLSMQVDKLAETLNFYIRQRNSIVFNPEQLIYEHLEEYKDSLEYIRQKHAEHNENLRSTILTKKMWLTEQQELYQHTLRDREQLLNNQCKSIEQLISGLSMQLQIKPQLKEITSRIKKNQSERNLERDSWCKKIKQIQDRVDEFIEQQKQSIEKSFDVHYQTLEDIFNSVTNECA